VNKSLSKGGNVLRHIVCRLLLLCPQQKTFNAIFLAAWCRDQLVIIAVIAWKQLDRDRSGCKM